MRIHNVYGQYSSAALSARSVFGWLAGRVHNLAQLSHALIFYCCCLLAFPISLGCTCGANVDGVGAWQQYLSGLGFIFFALWVPILVQIRSRFRSHFGTPNWCPILSLLMVVAKRFLKLGPFRIQKWDPFGGLKGFLFSVG